MKTTIVTAIEAGEAADVARRLIEKVQGGLGGQPASLLVVFASTAQPLDQILPPLAAAFPGAVTLGTSTSGEFTEKGDAKGSTSVFALAGDYRVFAGLGTGLKASPDRAVEKALEGLPGELAGYPHRTALLLLDPMAGNGEEVTLITAGLLGPDARLAGGASGDDLQMRETHVGVGGHAAKDAVVVAVIFSKSPLGVGVCHSHEPFSPPLRVTRAEGNVVAQLDGRPAWPVWLEHTRERAGRRGVDVNALRPDEEGAFLLRYEAALAAGTEHKIRAPLSRTEEGAINFACGIPEGAVIRITESQPKSQVGSAREAARRARAQLGAEPAGALVFDCICRKLILEDAFSTAVSAISEELGGVPLAGFETYGEIALDAGDMSGFHNTTSVVLAFPKG